MNIFIIIIKINNSKFLLKNLYFSVIVSFSYLEITVIIILAGKFFKT